MLENLPLILAVLLVLLSMRLIAPKGLQSVIFTTVNLGFFFWYWIPSVQVINFPPPSLLSSFVLRTDMVFEVSWIVLLYHFVTVSAIVFARKILTRSSPAFEYYLSFEVTAWILLASTFGALVATFVSSGPGVLLDILAGRVSSREFLTYYNFSQGVGQSLLALWDICNIAIAVFLIAFLTCESRLLSLYGALAGFSLVLSFLGSGTRAILMVGIFAVLIGYVFRTVSSQQSNQQKRGIGSLRYIYLTVFGGAAALASTGIVARFAAFRNEDAGFFANTFFNNNDMFRELVFIKTYMMNYQPRELGREIYNFLLTPFSFILPRFLGFDKEIPDHLIAFNQMRANINLVSGQGNVFPGLISDFHMLFGVSGPVVFAIFILAFGAVLRTASSWIPSQSATMAFWVAMCANLFVSFRNISGSLALIGLLLLTLIWLWVNVVPTSRRVVA